MPHFLHPFTPPSTALVLPGIWPILTLRYIPEGVDFGDKWISRDFRKISGNRVQSVVWRGAFRTLIASKNAIFSESFLPLLPRA